MQANSCVTYQVANSCVCHKNVVRLVQTFYSDFYNKLFIKLITTTTCGSYTILFIFYFIISALRLPVFIIFLFWLPFVFRHMDSPLSTSIGFGADKTVTVQHFYAVPFTRWWFLRFISLAFHCFYFTLLSL